MLLSFGTTVRFVKKNSQIGKCAANFVSLAREKEIDLDLAFLSDFYLVYFHEHMEYNGAVDKQTKRSGFIAHHHLVRYYLKDIELNRLREELLNGSIEPPPSIATLNEFWTKLVGSGAQSSLNKARSFIDVLTINGEIVKIEHNVWYQRVKEAVTVTSLPKQGSYVRYEKDVARFEAALDVEYNRSAREQQSGVTKTPHMEGKIPSYGR